MMRKQFECDGCGLIDLVEQDAPSGKIRSGVMVSINGGSDKVYDMCVNCEAHLTRHADPKSWPRVAETESA